MEPCGEWNDDGSEGGEKGQECPDGLDVGVVTTGWVKGAAWGFAGVPG